jgi:hypothetical protein
MHNIILPSERPAGMSDLIQLSKDNDVVITTNDNPPVNALAPAVQERIDAARLPS